MKSDVKVYFALFLVTIGLLTAVWAQKKKGPNHVMQQIVDKPYGTITTLIDTLFNTWSLSMTGATLSYNWKPNGMSPMTVWDSSNGVCNYSASIASLTAAVNATTVEYLDSSVVLGQTPMYIDEMGIQRTFQLKLYSGDLRIESTNGERAKNGSVLSSVPAFWSMWNRDVTGATDYVNQPRSWPLPFSDIIWQRIGDNFGFVAQFQTSGDLVAHATYNLDNYFKASTFSYTC